MGKGVHDLVAGAPCKNWTNKSKRQAYTTVAHQERFLSKSETSSLAFRGLSIRLTVFFVYRMEWSTSEANALGVRFQGTQYTPYIGSFPSRQNRICGFSYKIGIIGNIRLSWIRLSESLGRVRQSVVADAQAKSSLPKQLVPHPYALSLPERRGYWQKSTISLQAQESGIKVKAFQSSQQQADNLQVTSQFPLALYS